MPSPTSSPKYERDKEAKTMAVTFEIAETPRVYVERVDVNGNTVTQDKVIRREFRLAEGDPFNSVRVKRSRDRIQSLGFFQDNLEIEQTQGSTPDRVILAVDVEEKATGELQLSAGFSSLERFIAQRLDPPAQLHGQGPGASRLDQLFQLFEVGRARLHRALSVRSQHRARLRHLSPRPKQLQLHQQRRATRPISRSRPAARSAPACRSTNI